MLKAQHRFDNKKNTLENALAKKPLSKDDAGGSMMLLQQVLLGGRFSAPVFPTSKAKWPKQSSSLSCHLPTPSWLPASLEPRLGRVRSGLLRHLGRLKLHKALNPRSCKPLASWDQSSKASATWRESSIPRSEE